MALEICPTCGQMWEPPQLVPTLFTRGEHVFRSAYDRDRPGLPTRYTGMGRYRPSDGDVLILSGSYRLPSETELRRLDSAKVPVLGFGLGWARGCIPAQPGNVSLRWTIKRRWRWRRPRPPRGSPAQAYRDWRDPNHPNWRGVRRWRWYLVPYVYHLAKAARCGDLPDSAIWWWFEVEPGSVVDMAVEVYWTDGRLVFDRDGYGPITVDGYDFGDPEDADSNVYAIYNYWDRDGYYPPFVRLDGAARLRLAA